jgi:acetyl esterase/lipase
MKPVRFITALPTLLFLVVSGKSLAQSQAPITVPPPPIAFPDWKQVDVTDELTEYEVSFPSAVATPYPNNNVVPVRIFVPIDGKSTHPVVVVLHYWGATDLRPERSLASELSRRGIAAAVMTLPYHLARTPPGRRSGELAIEPDVERLKITTLQSVLDVRRTIDFLVSKKEFDPTRIGITGTSLGALVTALAFAVDDRISGAAFLLGGADFAHIMWSSSRVVLQRDVLRRRGFTEEKLRASLKDIEPLTYLPNRKTGTSFVIGAKFDTVITNESTEDLIRALPNPKVLWIDTGHYGGVFVQRRLMREVANYFGAEFNGSKYVAPENLYAPTLRVGIKADTGSAFDLAIGLDLLRLDARGEAFASLLLTPRGPTLFAGKRITPVLAIGGFFSFRSTGLGIFWSTVL